MFKLVPPEDFPFLQTLSSELFKLYFFQYEYLQLDRSATKQDTVYAEGSKKKFKDSIQVLAWTNRAQRPRVLTRFGFNTPRDLLLVFPTAILDELKIWPDVGDRIVVDEGLYEITIPQASGRWPNTNPRFYAACQCDRVPEENVAPGEPILFVDNTDEIFKKID